MLFVSSSAPRLLSTLTPEQAEQVRDLRVRAADVDGVSPLSEQSLLHLATGSGSVRHHLSYAGERLAGYAQVDTAAGELSAELVVDPKLRRRGLGSALWRAITGSAGPAASSAPGADDSDLRVWAHGNLPSAQGFAAAHGLVAVRELHKMARALSPADVDAPDTALPPGFLARSFQPGRDEQGWLETNAAAFAGHPEQGRLGPDDLQERMGQDWFDPAGLILVEDADAPGRLAAFHWTKVDPGQRSTLDPTRTAGEVYVVGVHPAYQGRGLGRPVTALGLSHLASLGLPEVVLYVDGDNTAALRTYTGLGFRSIMVDVMYSRGVHQQLSG
jgi:mycothiol synthase